MAKERKSIADILKGRNRTGADAGYDDEQERLREQSLVKNKSSKPQAAEDDSPKRKGASLKAPESKPVESKKTELPKEPASKQLDNKPGHLKSAKLKEPEPTSNAAKFVKELADTKEDLKVTVDKTGGNQYGATSKAIQNAKNTDLSKPAVKISEEDSRVNVKLETSKAIENLDELERLKPSDHQFFKPVTESDEIDFSSFIIAEEDNSTAESGLYPVLGQPKEETLTEPTSELSAPKKTARLDAAEPTEIKENKPLANTREKSELAKLMSESAATTPVPKYNTAAKPLAKSSQELSDSKISIIPAKCSFHGSISYSESIAGALLTDSNMNYTYFRLLQVILHAVSGDVDTYVEFRHKDFTHRTGGINESNVKRCLKKMEEIGFIKRSKARHNTAWAYALNGDYYRKFSSLVFDDTK